MSSAVAILATHRLKLPRCATPTTYLQDVSRDVYSAPDLLILQAERRLEEARKEAKAVEANGDAQHKAAA